MLDSALLNKLYQSGFPFKGSSSFPDSLDQEAPSLDQIENFLATKGITITYGRQVEENDNDLFFGGEVFDNGEPVLSLSVVDAETPTEVRQTLIQDAVLYLL